MNKDTINRTIAEALGAKIISKKFGDSTGYKWAWDGDPSTPVSYPGGGLFGHGWLSRADTAELPRYTDCLNAMNSAEVWLRGTDEEYRSDPVHHIRWNTYQDYLIRKFGISASARNRADTFVKVIGKWETPTGEENE
jgi:hypothetical protein